MQEDRRPNVGGVPLPQEDPPGEEVPGGELQREARLLRDRRRVDGHEPAEPDQEEGDAPG